MRLTEKNELQTATLEELCFDVIIQENPRTTNSEYSRVVVGVINGQEMDLNYCSPRYELVENSKIFPEIERILNAANIKFEVEYQHINYVRFYVDYTITDKRFEHKIEGTNDSIYPLIRVRHSYNGQTKYAIMFGYFRMICSNGLVVPVEEMKENNLAITGKHTASILNSLNQLNETLSNFAENKNDVITKILAKYQIMANSNVHNVSTRIEEILKASGINAVENNNMNTITYISKLIHNEAKEVGLGYNGNINDWLVYNGINVYINDNSLNIAAPETRREKDSKVFEYILATAA